MGVPSNIPDHELLHSIGKGSYGEVWLARSVLGTLRAVKIVRRDALSGVRPFEREYLGIQRFEPISRSHEGLVDVLQVGRNEAEGFFYYVMELADPAPSTEPGPYAPRTLSSDLARLKRLPASDCVRLFHGLALAMAHLHRAGLVHRDIKPSNIVFVNGVAKFADIGLVAEVDNSHSYVGTEGFIAPEGAGTVASDIYSFGKVLYECGTGRDRTEFPILPPELVELGAVDGIMELNAIWLKACALSPQDRYRTAEDLAADLALLQAGRSVKGLRVAEARLRRARQISRVAAVIAICALAAALVVRQQAARERESREKETRLRVRAELAEKTAEKRLEESRVAEARAILQSRRIGRSAEVLARLTNEISPELMVEARSLAASALVLPDLLQLPDTADANPPPVSRIAPQKDGSIRVLAPADEPGRAVVVIPGQGENVREPLQLSDDGRYLYAGYGAYVERVWDLSNGRKVVQLDTNYYSLAFRPGRPQAAVVYTNGDVMLHNLPGWEVVGKWPGQATEGSAAWSPDGGHLMYRAESGGVGVIQPEANTSAPPSPTRARTTTEAWHPNGRKFAFATDDNYLRLGDVESWREYAVLARHEGKVIRTLFLPPFPWILSSAWDGTSQLWDWHAGYELGYVEATGYDISYDPEAMALTWRLGDESTVHRWKLNGGAFSRQFNYGDPHQIGGAFLAAFSADCHWMAAPDTDFLRVWNLSTGEEALRIAGYSQSAWLSADGRELYSELSHSLRHWRLTPRPDGKLDAEQLPELGASPEGAKLGVSSDGTVLALLADNNVELWDHGAHHVWRHGQELAETIALSPDGRWVAVGTRNHIGARVFDVVTRKLAWRSSLRYGTHFAFSADSRWLAIATDHGCGVYSAASGEPRWVRMLPGGKDPTFWEIAFSPDGSTLAWTPKVYLVQLMDAASGKEILTLDYPVHRYTTGLAFSPDGQWLAESSNKHVVHLWDVHAIRKELGARGLGW